MGRIRILSDQVANKIAAGEVVERPASVVKELLENSLDAGAAELRIEVESGGRRLVRIADDGCGMLRDDALLAFERHATSKLRDVKDLLSISTLGFRGEALPSIASVSRLLLETRSAEETTGTRIEIAGGKMLRCEEAALGGGTAITVRDLFYNVPARKKFLRTEQTELAHIASLVTHYSLAHPEKTFQLISGATELLYVTPVATLAERVYQVFGGRTLEDLVEIGDREKDLFMAQPSAPPSQAIAEYRAEPDEPPTCRVCCGFFSRPQVQKANRNSIYHLRQRPPDSRPAAAARALLGVSQPDAARRLSVRAAVSRVRCRRGGRQRASVENRSPLPPRLVRPRFRPRHDARPADGKPPRAFVHARSGAFDGFAGASGRETAVLGIQPDDRGRAAVAASEPSRRRRLSGSYEAKPAALPEFSLRPAAGPSPRLDFSAPPLQVTPGPAPSGKLSRRLDAHGEFPNAGAIPPAETSLTEAGRFPICARWGRSMRALSLRRDGTGCGSSISMWRTSAFCSSRS